MSVSVDVCVCVCVSVFVFVSAAFALHSPITYRPLSTATSRASSSPAHAFARSDAGAVPMSGRSRDSMLCKARQLGQCPTPTGPCAGCGAGITFVPCCWCASVSLCLCLCLPSHVVLMGATVGVWLSPTALAPAAVVPEPRQQRRSPRCSRHGCPRGHSPGLAQVLLPPAAPGHRNGTGWSSFALLLAVADIRVCVSMCVCVCVYAWCQH